MEEGSPSLDTGFQSLTQAKPAGDPARFWQAVRERVQAGGPQTHRPSAAPQGSVMEAGVAVIAALEQAPARTLHSTAIVRSSPLSFAVRAMLERREFGRRYDAIHMDLDAIQRHLPGVECPAGAVQFLADDRTFDDLGFSVDGLLQHRRNLLARTVNPDQPRKHALILGAGPGGLMVAIQMSLRGHHAVVCELREAYARNRYIGVYKEVSHLMASLGMPERMTYDFSQYRDKRGIMLADIQTFLHGVALKLGVIIYMGAVPRSLNRKLLQSGEVELQRAGKDIAAAPGQESIGMVRWQHDTVSRVRSGVTIRFDTIVEATGGRAGLRELLVGPENVVSIRRVGKEAAERDPSLKSYFDDPNDHCAEYVESGYGCPPGLRGSFAAALLAGGDGEIPDEIPCFVSNIDASIFTKPMRATANSLGLASRIGDRDLVIPHDWVVLECRLADQSLSRYHIEGPLPQTFEFAGTRLSTKEALDTINPVSLLFRVLYAMGVPFDAVDRRRLIEFYQTESSYGDTSDIVSTWIGRFQGLRLGGEDPLWRGRVPGSETIEYGILGEALQNAWYRFGVGIDDTFVGATRFAEGFDLAHEQRRAAARRFAGIMTSRSVQVLYHLYAVARNTDQGVVGPVLTEYQMDEQRSADLAEARQREIARQGAEMLAAAVDVRGVDALLDASLEHEREGLCRRVLNALESLSYPPELLVRALQPMQMGDPHWRSRAFTALETVLSSQDREMLLPLFSTPESREATGDRLRHERLVELALGRYGWVTAWLQSCALRALDARSPGAHDALTQAAADSVPLVAETAAAQLALNGDESQPSVGLSTIDKVLVLKAVGLFREIPHQELAGVASLLNDRWAAPNARIVEKGDVGDCLYVIESGSVRVHDGDRTLAVLSRHDSFGELSLLDAEPRSASVTAVDRTHLFRLDQADFYELLRAHPEITKAINHALCHMVRAANTM